MTSNKYTKVSIEEFNQLIFEDLTPEEKTQYLAHSLELALKESGEEVKFGDVKMGFKVE